MDKVNTRGCTFPTCFRTTMQEDNAFCYIHDAEWQQSLNDWQAWKEQTDNPGYMPADSYEEARGEK